MSDTSFWRKCSNCKKPIAFATTYWVCSVSTCNRKRTGLVFCSVNCWDAHLPIMRHKEAWAEERKSPASAAVADAAPNGPRRLDMRSAAPRPPVSNSTASSPTSHPSNTPAEATSDEPLSPPPPAEVLAVASKVKAYIRARSGLNVSAGVMDALSDHIRALCDASIREARRNERKTVLDRDVPRVGPRF